MAPSGTTPRQLTLVSAKGSHLAPRSNCGGSTTVCAEHSAASETNTASTSRPAVARRRGIGSRGFRKAENQDARRKRLTVPFGLIFWTTVCEITTVHPHAPGIDFSEDQAAPFKMRKLRLFILAPRPRTGCSTHVHSAAAYRQVYNHHATELVVWPRSVDLRPRCLQSPCLGCPMQMG